jgi:hypothetical protein
VNDDAVPASPSEGARPDDAGDVVSPDGVLGPGEFPAAGTTGITPALAGEASSDGDSGQETAPVPDVSSPATVIRIGAMAKQLLEELRQTEMDEPARDQLRKIYESSIDQLQEALSPELAEELERLSFAFRPDATPSDAELRLAEAQLVGWLEGLFHGIQAMLVAQQVQAQQQLQGMRAQLAERTGPPTGGPGYI